MSITGREIPRCPKCKRERSLILCDGLRVVCARDVGGCGSVFDVWGIAAFYEGVKMHLGVTP